MEALLNCEEFQTKVDREFDELIEMINKIEELSITNYKSIYP